MISAACGRVFAGRKTTVDKIVDSRFLTNQQAAFPTDFVLRLIGAVLPAPFFVLDPPRDGGTRF
jgi:hypothetical protein